MLTRQCCNRNRRIDNLLSGETVYNKQRYISLLKEVAAGNTERCKIHLRYLRRQQFIFSERDRIELLYEIPTYVALFCGQEEVFQLFVEPLYHEGSNYFKPNVIGPTFLDPMYRRRPLEHIVKVMNLYSNPMSFYSMIEELQAKGSGSNT